jgi:hypothetical protein
MPNLPTERERLKRALGLIAGKYSRWLGGNPRLLTLMGSKPADFDNHIHFEDERAFLVSYYSIYKEALLSCQLLGFFVGTNRADVFHLYINRSKASDNTIVHELFHLLAHENFKANVKSPSLNEAITEYFTRKVTGQNDPLKALEILATTGMAFKQNTAYEKELSKVNAARTSIKENVNPVLRDHPDWEPELASVGTKDMFKRAYFNGELAMINLIKQNYS